MKRLIWRPVQATAPVGEGTKTLPAGAADAPNLPMEHLFFLQGRSFQTEALFPEPLEASAPSARISVEISLAGPFELAAPGNKSSDQKSDQGPCRPGSHERDLRLKSRAKVLTAPEASGEDVWGTQEFREMLESSGKHRYLYGTIGNLKRHARIGQAHVGRFTHLI